MDHDEVLRGLRRELEQGGPDALWLDVVTRVVCRHERLRPDQAGDLVQDLFVNRLLDISRAAYIAEVSTNLRHAENLIKMQLRQLKDDQRERPAAERVTDRVKALFQSRFPSFGEHASAGFGDPAKARHLRPEEIDRGARIVLRWRRLPDEGQVRASRIFDPTVLKEGVEQLLEILGDNFYISDIYGIFYRAFTAVGLTRFVVDAGHEELRSDRLTLDAEEARDLEDTVTELERALSEQQLKVLALWVTHDTQEARARELGVSRPTLLKRQDEANAVASLLLKDLPRDVAEMALQELVSRNRYL